MITKACDNRNSCGTQIASSCVPYTGKILKNIEANDLPCNANINDIFESITDLIDGIKTSTDLTTFNKGCLDSCESCSPLTVHEALTLLKTKVCELKTKVDSLEEFKNNLGSTQVEVDLACLSDSPCASTSNTLTSVLNVIINEICQLKSA